MLLRGWNDWLQRTSGGPFRLRAGTGRRVRSLRLRLERLEERIAPTTHTWTGAQSSLWSNAGNWIGGSPAGDPAADLQFPSSGVTRFTSTDDLAGQTAINSIQFSGSGFTVDASTGNSIGLGTGVSSLNTTGTNTVSLPVFLVPGSHFVSTSGAGTLVLSGAISGTGGLFLSGTGEVVISSSNTQLTGGVTLNSGTLTVGSNNAVGTALLVLGSGLFRSNGPLTLPNNYQVGSIGLPGSVTIGGNNNLTLTGQGSLLADDLTVNSTATISLTGNISGPNGIFMLGTGTLILSGMNTFSGDTTIRAGTVLVNGTNSASQALLSAGTLGGTGFVSAISATGGMVSPGNATTIGTLTTDSFQLNPSTTVAVKLRTTGTGNVADQLVARRSGNLGGSTLQLNPLPGFLSPVGDTFNLVTNGGTGTITGSFANSSPITIPGNGRFQLTYSAAAVTLTHINTPPTLSAINVTSPVYETRPATLTGTITDPDPLDAFTLTITWGDGSPVQTVNLAAGSTAFSVPHTYTRESNPTYTIGLTVSDGHPGGIATASTTVSVLDRFQSPAALALTGVEGQSFSAPVATFQDAVDGAITDFSATINWGDGSPTANGPIAKTGPGRFQVNGTHTYMEEGSYAVVVTIRDSDGTTVSPRSTATVADATLSASGTTFSAVEGQSSNHVVATFTDVGNPEPVGNSTAIINWGDGTPTTTGTVSLSGAVFSVSGSHVYSEEGSYQVTIMIHDEGGFTATPTGIANVADAPLIPAPGQFSVCGAEGRALSNISVGIFSDSGGFEQPANYSVTINWGDSTPASAGTISQSGVSGSHTYASEGTYSITITVSHETASPIILRATATIGGFVTSLYKEVLGRVPDAPGLSFWVGQLHAGTPRDRIARAFWDSPEHRGIEVDQYYATFLRRPADPVGRAGWVNALLSGTSEGAVVIAFLTSPEYTASHSDNATFVTGLYSDLLRRPGDAGGLGFWQDQLRTGARSRAGVVLGFLSSTEAYVQAIDDYYAAFLGRSPDPVGQGDFLAALQSGQATPTSITAVFLSSDEYFARALALACQ